MMVMRSWKEIADSCIHYFCASHISNGLLEYAQSDISATITTSVRGESCLHMTPQCARQTPPVGVVKAESKTNVCTLDNTKCSLDGTSFSWDEPFQALKVWPFYCNFGAGGTQIYIHSLISYFSVSQNFTNKAQFVIIFNLNLTL